MSESLDGLMLPATRQNAGTLASAGPAGGVNDPAATSAAVAMVIRGEASAVRLSQVAAEAGSAAKKRAQERTQIILIEPPRFLRVLCASASKGQPLFARHQHARRIEPLPHYPVVQDLEAHRIDQLRHTALHLPS